MDNTYFAFIMTGICSVYCEMVRGTMMGDCSLYRNSKSGKTLNKYHSHTSHSGFRSTISLLSIS
ncbi:hypothetical protein LINGRAHAP2_LOCUS14476 [Linum grandiflorum]